MAEIQAALPAKFMQVASAHKTGPKDVSAPGAQLASFFGMLKSQLARQEVTPEALELQSESGKKALSVELDADPALPTASADALVNQPMSAAVASEASMQQAATMGLNMAAEKPVAAASQEADIEATPGRQAEAGEVKSVGLAKPDALIKSGGAAIAAASGQVLPLESTAEPAESPLAALASASAGEVVGEAATAVTLPSASGLRVDAGAASGAPITLAHPFDQALRQAETKINAAIEAPVRSPAFAAELSDKVVWLATRQGQFADMSLNPPQMGALEVRLTLSGSDASAQFFSPNPVVREAIDAALPRLRELMAQAGINLGEADVREQAFGRRENAGFGAQNPGQNRAQEGENPVHPAAMAGVGAGRSAGLGLVDLYI